LSLLCGREADHQHSAIPAKTRRDIVRPGGETDLEQLDFGMSVPSVMRPTVLEKRNKPVPFSKSRSGSREPMARLLVIGKNALSA
jgi:hypothetical protein